jgi:hypothetical protein
LSIFTSSGRSLRVPVTFSLNTLVQPAVFSSA